MIHKTAIVDSKAKISDNVEIGPYSIIGPQVEIEANTVLHSHVNIVGNTKIGKNNEIYQFSSIGTPPQDLKYKGEKNSLIIGNNNKFREYVNINPGTEQGGGLTRIGHNNLFMVYCHVAHDCILGDNVIMSNLSTLGGHVELEDWVILGGGVLIHQFTKVGSHAFIGGGFRAVQDVPPYILAAENPLEFKSVNSLGLKRRGFSLKDRKQIKKIYKIYFRSGSNRMESLNRIIDEMDSSDVKNQIVNFIKSSQRGII